jgi:translation elongation factor EF-1alpha
MPLLTKWYNDGPCLVDFLDTFNLPQRNVIKPLRVCIYDYYKASSGSLVGDCVQVKIESGIIKEKDEVLLMPLNILV